MTYRTSSFIFVLLFLSGGLFYMWHIPADKQTTPADLSLALPRRAPFTVRYQIKAMTLREKAGQLLMVSFPGTVLDEKTAEWMKHYAIGGVIVLGGNVVSEEQTKKLLADLSLRVGKELPSPLLVAVDQEGGPVSRFQWSGLELRSQKEATTTEGAYMIALRRGTELHALGAHINFSPVLDVASTTRDFIHGRTFAGDAEDVAARGSAMIRGYRDGGIIPVAKHFPGHGGTVVDSHKKLPVITRSESEWRAHLRPFAEAIRSRVPVIMTAHVVVSSVDDSRPASVSRKMLSGVLREELGFTGVVISDDLGMGALSGKNDLVENAVRALEAGTDLLLIVRGVEEYGKVIAALEAAVVSGRIAETQLDASLERVLLLKHDFIR